MVRIMSTGCSHLEAVAQVLFSQGLDPAWLGSLAGPLAVRDELSLASHPSKRNSSRTVWFTEPVVQLILRISRHGLQMLRRGGVARALLRGGDLLSR